MQLYHPKGYHSFNIKNYTFKMTCFRLYSKVGGRVSGLMVWISLVLSGFSKPPHMICYG